MLSRSVAGEGGASSTVFPCHGRSSFWGRHSGRHVQFAVADLGFKLCRRQRMMPNRLARFRCRFIAMPWALSPCHREHKTLTRRARSMVPPIFPLQEGRRDAAHTSKGLHGRVIAEQNAHSPARLNDPDRAMAKTPSDDVGPAFFILICPKGGRATFR